MPRFVSLRSLGAVLLVAASACAKTDASSTQKTAASSGDVSANAKPATATPVAAAGTPGSPTDSISTMADAGRIRGDAAAPIWLIEVSDFQCPYCKRWHDESYQAIDREFVKTGKVRLAFLNFPIPSLHPNAIAASEAAMCASVQGKFWEMHESLFNSQDSWDKLSNPMPAFDSLSRAAGVDSNRWRYCVTSHASLALINADRDRLGTRGVQSTPTFYVGDEQILGAQPTDSFRVVIKRQIAKAAGGH
ncbi:MAG: DsbA family protein [Gemmatimonadota bacterium]|nr:DsbA family protein [Gemmatimonadota bacterium]